MCHAGNNHALELSEDFVERRGRFWCGCPQLRHDCSWLVVRRDPPLTDMLAVIGDPIGEPMKLFAKHCRRNIAEIADVPAQTWLSIFHSLGRKPYHRFRRAALLHFPREAAPEVDRAVVVAATSILNLDGEAANFFGIVRGAADPPLLSRNLKRGSTVSRPQSFP